MLHNKQSSPNTPPFPLMQPPAIAIPFDEDEDENDLEEIDFVE